MSKPGRKRRRKRRQRRKKRRKKMRTRRKSHRKGKIYSLKTCTPRTFFAYICFIYPNVWLLGI